MLRTVFFCCLALLLLACQEATQQTESPPLNTGDDHPTTEADLQASAPPVAAPLFPLCGDPTQVVDRGALPRGDQRAEGRFATSREVHRYTFDLKADEYVHIVVEQHQVDLVLGLVDAQGGGLQGGGLQGRSLLRVDSLYADRGVEEILWKSSEKASLDLWICGPRRVRKDGSYFLHVAAQHPASVTDARVADAFFVFQTAEAKRRQAEKPRLREAIGLYEQAAQQWKALARDHDYALALYEKGRVQTNLAEDLPEAVHSVEAALELLQSTGDRFLEGGALHRLGNLYLSLDKPDIAADLFAKALVIRRELDHRTGEMRTAIGLGNAFSSLSEYARSRDHYEEALKIAHELGREYEEGVLLFRLGLYYESLGDTKPALKKLESALEKKKKVEDTPGVADTHHALGRIHNKLGDLDQALSHLRKALILFESLDDTAGRVDTLNDLGLAELEKDRFDSSRKHLMQALEISGHELTRQTSKTHLVLGWLIAEEGRCDEAIPKFEEAVKGFEESHAIAFGAQAHRSLAICNQRLGNLDDALAQIQRAVSLIEFIRDRALSMSWKSKYFAGKRSYYDTLIDILVAIAERNDSLPHMQLALEASERTKARTLLDAIAAKAQSSQSEMNTGSRTKTQQLEEKIYQIEVQRLFAPQDPGSDAESRRLEDHLRTLLEQYEIVTRQARFETVQSDQNQPLGLAQIRQELGEDTTLLEFQIGNRQSHLWLVDSSRLLHYRLPHKSEIEKLASIAYRNLSSKSRPVQTELLLERLREKLLLSALEEIKTERILIVKDGPLLYLPFETLPSAARDPSRDTSTRRIGDDFEFVGAPSVSILAQLRRNRAVSDRAPSSSSIAIVADPVFNRDDERLSTAHRVPTLSGTDLSEASQPAGSWDHRLDRLIYSRSEGQAIAEIARRNDWQTRLLAGFDATKSIIKSSDLNRHQILHFATHANFNFKQPELAYLVLSQFDAQAAPIAGHLFAYELNGLDLRAETVVLSACSGALGSEIRGEGLVGLTQGFLRAGAARVLVSLWQVDDRATAELMRHFYLELLEHHAEPAAALRAAKDHVRRKPGWESPYYWAGFSLQGEWEP